MRDLTTGSIPRHLINMAVPIAAGMLFQTAYLLVDLYFVGHLGDAALGGVGAAANIGFLVMAITQALGVGTVALIAQAVGRKDQDGARLVFNQSLVLAMFCGAACLVLGYLLAPQLIAAVSSAPATRAAGVEYLYWYLPGLAAQFALVAMGSALRGTGIVKPMMLVQMVTVVINIILAPVLIGGWGTGHPLGVAGAGLASSIAVIAGVLLVWVYYLRLEHYVQVDRTLLGPKPAVWSRIIAIGAPSGGEFAMMFIIMSFIYWAISVFGPSAQAGFGVGGRVMQAIFLPAMAVSFAVAPIAGQNFGAGRFERVRSTLNWALLMGSALMLLATLLCQWTATPMVAVFAQAGASVATGTDYLKIISWNFVAMGVIFTCSGVFQGLGNTWPSLWSSAMRLLTFVLPVVIMHSRPGYTLHHVWFASVASAALQALTSWSLLQWVMKNKLQTAAAPTTAPATSAAG